MSSGGNRGLGEHYPLSRLDELPIHQYLEPLRFMATTDPRAFERYWFTAQDDEGDAFLVTGMGFYPNLGTADAYAILVHDNIHTSLRAHRPLGEDRSSLIVGPLRYEPIEPFTEWRLVLDENPRGLQFDIRWRDTKRAVFQRYPARYGVPDWRLLHEWAGYETFGTIEGTIQCHGKNLQLRHGNARGSRDHHWGIRNLIGGRGHMLPDHSGSHLGQWVEFGDWSIWGRQVLYNLGDERAGASQIEPIECRMRFDPVTKHLIGGVIVNRAGNGEIREVSYQQIGKQVAYLRCGMYPGVNDKGTPEEDYHLGMPVGELIGGETYDLNDTETVRRIAGFEDHLMQATCGGESAIGILECRNPALYEQCRQKVRGFSLLE